MSYLPYMKSFARAALIFSALSAPTVTFAAIPFSVSISIGNVCTGTICGIGQNIIYIINNVLVPVLFAVAFIVFLYGIAKAYIFSAGESAEVQKGHQLILWGLIGFAVMVSLWGLVNVVANTFGLTGAYAPLLPLSY